MSKIQTNSLSQLFYTVDTYGQFSTSLLDDDWFDESEFDSKGFMDGLAELHAQVIGNELPAGPVASVKVVGHSSPREYNFYTDQVELEIDVDIDGLYRYLQKFNHEKEFEKFIEDNFTSCSGFISFTPNNLKEFYAAIDNKDSNDHDKCVGILAGWYLSREALTEGEYLDKMYDEVREVMWENFAQFTDETYEEYHKYKEEFERQKAQIDLFPEIPRRQYPMEIEEWYEEVKEKELESVEAN